MEAMALDLAAVADIPQAPKRDLTGLSKRLWLLLYAEGGRWTADEIGKRLHISQPLWSCLGEMSRGAFLERFRSHNVDGELVVSFAVTKRCKVPRGVTVDEMWEVLQMSTPRAK